MLQIDWYIHIDISTASCHISQLIIQRFALSSVCLHNIGTQLSGSICNSKSIITLIIHRT
jgi:hypothetical protein